MVQIIGRPQNPERESILRSDFFCFQDMFTKKSRLEATEEEMKCREILAPENYDLGPCLTWQGWTEKTAGCPGPAHSLGLLILLQPTVSQLPTCGPVRDVNHKTLLTMTTKRSFSIWDWLSSTTTMTKVWESLSVEGGTSASWAWELKVLYS